MGRVLICNFSYACVGEGKKRKDFSNNTNTCNIKGEVIAKTIIQNKFWSHDHSASIISVSYLEGNIF